MDQRPRTAQLLDLALHPESVVSPPGYPGERSAAIGIYFLLTLTCI